MSTLTRSGRLTWLVGAALGASLGIGCGALRQNLRNEFLSYRGAYHCADGPCKLKGMVRSTTNHREGTVNITHVKIDPRAALVFYPGTPVKTFSAKVECKGETFPVLDNRIKGPGEHPVKGEGDAYVIVIDPTEYEFSGNCKTYRVTAHATWESGKSFDETAGLQRGG